MDPDAVGGGLGALFGGLSVLLYLACLLFGAVVFWKLYAKAGKPGWAGIIPIYNIIVLMEIVGRPTWWTILFFIPIANIVAAVLVNIDLAKSFGRDVVFGILMTLIPIIFVAVLAFGSATYRGPAAATTPSVV
jgi:hypothetical protein